MRELYRLDQVAYIRFASVYRSFQGVDDFQDVIKEVQKPVQSASKGPVLSSSKGPVPGPSKVPTAAKKS
jgi:hypothetical protein